MALTKLQFLSHFNSLAMNFVIHVLSILLFVHLKSKNERTLRAMRSSSCLRWASFHVECSESMHDQSSSTSTVSNTFFNVFRIGLLLCQMSPNYREWKCALEQER